METKTVESVLKENGFNPVKVWKRSGVVSARFDVTGQPYQKWFPEIVIEAQIPVEDHFDNAVQLIDWYTEDETTGRYGFRETAFVVMQFQKVA